MSETGLTEDGGGSKDGGEGEGGGNEGDEEAKKEEEARKKEEEEEVKLLVKAGAQTLLPVLGEEVTAKVRWASGDGKGGGGAALCI